MEDEIHAYWRNRLTAEMQQRDEIGVAQRDEIARLQGRCQELLTANTMATAAVTMEVRNWALANTAANGTINAAALQQYLYQLSGGLLPALDNERKRVRGRPGEEGSPMAAVGDEAPIPPQRPGSVSPMPQAMANAAMAVANLQQPPGAQPVPVAAGAPDARRFLVAKRDRADEMAADVPLGPAAPGLAQSIDLAQQQRRQPPPAWPAVPPYQAGA